MPMSRLIIITFKQTQSPYIQYVYSRYSESETEESEPDNDYESDDSLSDLKLCAELEVTEPEPDDDNESSDSMPELIEVSNFGSDGAFDNDDEMNHPKWSSDHCFQCDLRRHDGSGSCKGPPGGAGATHMVSNDSIDTCNIGEVLTLCAVRSSREYVIQLAFASRMRALDQHAMMIHT
jgi:hypothetical protein